ncbi:MAG: MarR family transcriptional regulator [Solirubrobacteraceae bacterium]
MAAPSAADVRDALHAFGLERDRLTAALAQAGGIGENDLAAIEHLEQAGSLTQTELGDRLLLTRGSVTTLVDRLERAGWVRRGRHPEDRRLTVLTLRPDAGAAAGRLGVDGYEEQIALAAGQLGADGRAAAVRFLEAAAAAAAEHADRLRPSG